MTALHVLRPICVFALAATAYSQIRPQMQSSPAPDFLAYQALFRNIVSLESQASQADAAQGAGNASSAWCRSQIPKAAGLTNVEYAALVAIAQDFAQAKAGNVRNSVESRDPCVTHSTTPSCV
ncbi:MAG: hypothetical protein ACLQPN_14490 [Bryobacteraceae bacterium]